MHFFKDWTLFERIWLTVFTLINIYLYIAQDSGVIGLVSAISGMLCVVLVAKGKIGNFFFGMINTATYAYISYTYQLYGEAMLNALFYFPLQFVGLWTWRQHRAVQQHVGEDIEVRRLSKRGRLIMTVSVAVSAAVYTQVLIYLNAQQVRLDSLAVVLSIAAQILMTLRYAEQWVLWILVNVLSIVLWLLTLINAGGSDYPMLAMWSAFLINSLYGFANWLKMSRSRAAETSAG